TPHLIGGYSHWRPHNAKQNESQFSDGTLRLLGLLWTVYEGSGPLLLEEPEISLHPEIVRRLPTIFYRINRSRREQRQLIISTHSEEMLSDKGIAPEEVLRLEPGPSGTRICPPDEADRQAMAKGLTAADVLMPKAAPENIGQLAFEF
ncbi:ATP-binding protein, partial [Candidatus Parcubacteria bacterium]